jgi:hypothetical protein
MKAEIFDQYVNHIIDLFKINKSELFTKCKIRKFSEARYLLYYLCYDRHISLVQIKYFMSENGYEVDHSPIKSGINVVAKRVKYDKDYIDIVKEIQNKVVI